MRSLRFAVTLLVAFRLDAAYAGWIVELHDGRTIVADDYWFEGDLAHCLQRGKDVTVPKSEIARATEGQVPALTSRTRARLEGTLEPDAPEEVQELQDAEQRVADHLLRTQAKLFEARNGGEGDVERLEREFSRTQKRWRVADTDLRAATNNERRPEADDGWLPVK